jgi:hypothetical protein
VPDPSKKGKRTTNRIVGSGEKKGKRDSETEREGKKGKRREVQSRTGSGGPAIKGTTI